MKNTFDQKTQQTVELLKALAHPLRIRIVLQLAQQESISINTLKYLTRKEQFYLSRNLTEMSDGGILTSTRLERTLQYSIANAHVIEAVQLLMDTLDKGHSATKDPDAC